MKTKEDKLTDILCTFGIGVVYSVTILLVMFIASGIVNAILS